jgi:hypothetical protein
MFYSEHSRRRTIRGNAFCLRKILFLPRVPNEMPNYVWKAATLKKTGGGVILRQKYVCLAIAVA